MRALRDVLAEISAVLEVPVSTFLDIDQELQNSAEMEKRVVQLLRALPEDNDRRSALKLLELFVAIRLRGTSC